MQQKVKINQIGVFWALRKGQDEAMPTGPPEGLTEEWKALKLGVKAGNVHSAVRKAYGELGGKWEMGQAIE
jgi:hypothetical protein